MKHRDHVALSPLMTVNELARYLKVSESTIYKLRRKGRLPFFKHGRGFHFDPYEIDTWIADSQIKGDKKPGRQRGEPSSARTPVSDYRE